ncbi:MAG TPA: hypothetical protein VHT53_03870 [Candidatus Elarobacter sp.]|nr:hypothetical protein [Candidatus Elarobacter sp.]
MNAPDDSQAVVERRRGERRTLANQRFLALLIGGLPEDRRRGERRKSDRPGP